MKKDAAIVEEGETVTVVNKTITGFSTDLTKVIESVSPQIVRVNAFHKSSSYIGSGVIYHVSDSEAIVVASAHGVSGALDLSVTFNNGESTAAELIGVDELTDLAVLKTKPSFSTTPVSLGSTSTLSLGEWVIAVGNNKRNDFAPARIDTVAYHHIVRVVSRCYVLQRTIFLGFSHMKFQQIETIVDRKVIARILQIERIELCLGFA